MAKTGPKPSCSCGKCQKCRRRKAAMRRYYGTVYPAIASGRFKKSRMRLPRAETTLAYVAGLMDGEGCLMVQNNSYKIQIAMTDKAVIHWLGKFGGNVNLRRTYGNRKPCWGWRVFRQSEVSEVLTAILPYLRVKKAICAEALKHIKQRARQRSKIGVQI